MPSGGSPVGIMPGMMPVMSSHADTITQPTMSGTPTICGPQPTPHPTLVGVPPIAATPLIMEHSPTHPCPPPGLQQMYPDISSASFPPNYPPTWTGPNLDGDTRRRVPRTHPHLWCSKQGCIPPTWPACPAGGPGQPSFLHLGEQGRHTFSTCSIFKVASHTTHLMAQHNQQ